ncbi:uncharacterized protein LOC124406526 [Diprion similis]|uniref:uncharacterized protein LOC124406526 n=1 Tax=Diprion similis TaxID=362088 RepID=UPI001EF78061|nr:uncharacterized protein LOC124406526 [Diprion similis]
MALIRVHTVEEEMKKNSKLKRSDLQMLRDWCKKQPHLPPVSDTDLTLFLHSNYYRLESTKTTIDAFYSVRTHIPELFLNRDPLGEKGLREIMQVVCCVFLPGTTPEGYRVILGKTIDPDPSRYVLADVIKLCSMIMELRLYTTGTAPGYVIIMDMDDTVFGHVARMNPMTVKKHLYYVQEALPIRLKSVHVINTAPFVEMLLNIAKPFMKKELMNMIFLHSSADSVSKRIPIDILPNDQGGKAGPLKDLWAAELRNLEEHRAWFLEEDMRKVDESLRPEKAKNITDIFGVEGSFKKLDIDYFPSRCKVPIEYKLYLAHATKTGENYGARGTGNHDLCVKTPFQILWCYRELTAWYEFKLIDNIMVLMKMMTLEEEVKKNSDLKKSDLDILRDWCKKQPHLPHPISDGELILFLHSNYYQIEATKPTIDTFHTVKTHAPDFCSNRDPLNSKNLCEIMKVLACVPLPGTTAEGWKMMLVTLLDHDPAHYVYVDAVKLLCMAIELWLFTEGTVPGHVLILDINGFTAGHLARVSLTVMKKCLYYIQEALPIRLKNAHLINTSPITDLVMNMMKPFTKNQFLNLVCLHTDLESLSKKIPTDLLPNEHGGKAGPLKNLWADEVRKIEEHRAWFLEEDKRKVNENLRPGKAKTATDLFGVDGSFKKLDID